MVALMSCTGPCVFCCILCNFAFKGRPGTLHHVRLMFGLIKANQLPHKIRKQMLNACPIPPMHIIVQLLQGHQSSILSSNEWHNDMHSAFTSTIMAPNQAARGTTTRSD